MDLVIVLPYIVCAPFLLASMIRKIVNAQKPTVECVILSLGALAIYFLAIYATNN